MTTFGERRVELATKMSEVEGITLQEAFRRVPRDKAGLDKLVRELNARRGAPRNADERKITEANRRADKTGESFSEAARFTR